MSKVSIIIPVYNTEKYIRKCLDSLVNQSLKDIEIICINDGSSDNSLKILKEYELKDNRIKVYSQKNNKQGSARNIGIKYANGEYIGYVDSDDWVDLTYFEKLYNSAKKYDLDIALATNIRIGGNKKTKKRLVIKEEKVYKNLQDKFDVCNQFHNECPTNKIYKKIFLEKNNICWPENCYCEDKLFTTKAIYFANGIVSVPLANYFYFRNPNSTVNTKHKNSKVDYKNEAKLSVIRFLREKNASLRDCEYWATTKKNKFFGITILSIKESLKSRKIVFLGIPIFKYKI